MRSDELCSVPEDAASASADSRPYQHGRCHLLGHTDFCADALAVPIPDVRADAAHAGADTGADAGADTGADTDAGAVADAAGFLFWTP